MDGSDQARYDALMAKVDELGQACARLSRENAELRDRVSRLSPGLVTARTVPGAPCPAGPVVARPAAGAPGGGAGEPGAGRSISRRKIGKALGAVAVSAVGAGALIEMAQPAAAANGNSVTAGNVTTGESRTSVLYDGTSGFKGVVLLGNDSTYDGSGANFPAGVGGWAGQPQVSLRMALLLRSVRTGTDRVTAGLSPRCRYARWWLPSFPWAGMGVGPGRISPRCRCARLGPFGHGDGR